MPFFNQDQKEQYWVGFCLRGGRGINYSGVSVSDPTALFMNKPNVNQQCIADKQHIPTIGISQPTNVQIKNVMQDLYEISWDEPTKNDGSAIQFYRIFLTDQDSSSNTFNFETFNSKTVYQFRAQKIMYGKSFVVTIQAINKNQKMSLVSETAIFTVIDITKKNQQKGTTITTGITTTILPAPITHLSATSATSKEIVLTWDSQSDAKDYKLYWDKGNTQETSLFYPLASSTNDATTFKVNNSTAGAGYFNQNLYKNGGSFSFKVSYILKTG